MMREANIVLWSVVAAWVVGVGGWIAVYNSPLDGRAGNHAAVVVTIVALALAGFGVFYGAQVKAAADALPEAKSRAGAARFFGGFAFGIAASLLACNAVGPTWQ